MTTEQYTECNVQPPPGTKSCKHQEIHANLDEVEDVVVKKRR